MANTLFNTNFRCPLCQRFHAIRQCSRFIVLPVEKKLRVVAQKALCYNCLAQSHARAQCKSIDRCRRCLQDHNSWLHPLPQGKIWLQMTAKIRIRTGDRKKETWTLALIDPTAARSSITRQEAESTCCVIHRNRTKVRVFHNGEQKYFDVELAVENKAFGHSPNQNVECLLRDEVPSCDANRYWYKRSEYFVILGADVMGRILLGPAKGKPGTLYIQDSVFGFLYFGEATILD